MDSKTTLSHLKKTLKQFNMERDWDQYHNPKDLILALTSEVGELAECYRWLNPEEIDAVHSDDEKMSKIRSEIADVFSYMITLAYKLDIDITSTVLEKLEKNKKRYPIDKSKSIHSNPLLGRKG